MIKTKYQIWDRGVLVPAWTRKPKQRHAIELKTRTAEEKRLRIRWYLPKEHVIETE